MFLNHVPESRFRITFLNYVRIHIRIHVCMHYGVQTDPTPFSAALITTGEFSRKSTKDEHGERLDCETVILKIYHDVTACG